MTVLYNQKSKTDTELAKKSNHITLKQPCRRCGGDKAFIKPTPPSSPHKAGLWCADCDSWIKWVGKNQIGLLVLESLVKGVRNDYLYPRLARLRS